MMLVHRLISAVGSVSVLLFAQAAFAVTTVVGTNDPTVDVPAVQAAVNAGGTVVLQGTFDFGPTGSVLIRNDVAIEGEDGATVRRGLRTFWAPLPAGRPVPPGPKISIKNVNFEGAQLTPLLFGWASGIEVQHSSISGILPVCPPTIPFCLQEGIYVGTQISGAGTTVIPGAITGEIDIRHNNIEMTNSIPEKTLAEGIWIELTWGANIDVRHNTVTNTSRNGIELLDNNRDPQGNGSVVVEHNTIVTPTTGISFPSPATPNGIVAGWFHNQAGSHNPAINSPVKVAHNLVEVRGNTSVGIVALSDGAVLSHNTILLNGGTQTIGMSVVASRCSLSHNEIAGSGLIGIRLAAATAYNPNSENVLLKDDASDLQAGQAGLVLLSNDNVVKNFQGTIDDQGTGNVIK